MADAFVSYSRKDSAFVRRLAESVSRQGKEMWLDTEGIADAEVFPQAIRAAIEQSDSFVFVITPAAVASAYCEKEVEYARELQKRIVPVLREAVPDLQLPAEIRDRNWIPFTESDQFEDSVERLMGALDRDLEHVKEHTRWLVKAIEWDAEGRDRSFLLRGSELKAAEAWLAASPEDAEPAPTPLQREYLLASREAAARRQRMLVGASGAIALISLGLLVFALISRSQAVSARTVATSRALAAESEAQANVDPQLAVLLGEQAVSTSHTPQALFALRGALDGSPLRMTLSTARLQCGFFGGPGIAYDPAAPVIAEAACNGDLETFESRSGHLLRRTRVGPFASSVAYSGDGSILAVGTAGGVLLLNARTGARRAMLPGGRENAVAISPDGSLVAATAPTGIGVWAIGHGAPRTIRRQHSSGALPTGGTPMTAAIAFIDGGREIVVGGGGPIAAHVLDAHTLRALGSLAGTGFTSQISASADDRRFAVASSINGSEGIVTVWDGASRRRLSTLARFPALGIDAVAFDPTGTRLALGAADGTGGLWAIRTGQQLASYVGPTSSVVSLGFSPDGSEVAAASSDGTTNVWRASGPEQTYIDAGELEPADVALGGKRVTITWTARSGVPLTPASTTGEDGMVRSWALPGGRSEGSFATNTLAGAGWLSPDASLVAAVEPPVATRVRFRRGPPPIEIRVWSVERRRVIATLHTAINLGWLAFSDDLRHLVLLGAPRSAVEGLTAGHAVTLQTASPCESGWRSASFSASGRLVAGADFCGNVYVWNAASGRRVSAFREGGEVSRIAFDPHAETQLAVGSWDSQITIWNVRSAKATRVLTGHTRGVSGVGYSPDGALLASSSLDRTVRIWDPSNGRLLRVLRQPAPAFGATFSPDGREVVSTDPSGIVRIWDACTACGDAGALMRLAKEHVTRRLSSLERATFLTG